MSTPTNLFPLNTRYPIADSTGRASAIFQKWLISLQMRLPLVTVDTTDGDVVIALPPAGLNSSTGQSNQNQEIIYRKISLDANTVTVTGSGDGPVVLTAGDGSAASRVKFKSDGTTWWISG